MGCEAGCLNGSGRDRVHLRPIVSDVFPRLDRMNELPGCHPRALPCLPELDHTLDLFTTSISQAKGAYQYIVESADSASKSPQPEAKREGA